MLRRLQSTQLVVVVSLALAAAAWAAPAPSYNFLSVANPNDTAFTQLLGINNFSTIAGYWGDGTVIPNHGFTLVLPNTFTPENFPGAAQTQDIGINNRQDAAGVDTVGFYIDTGGVTHGFRAHGAFSVTVDFPNPTSVLTQLLIVNDHGVDAGYWQNAGGTQFPFTFDGLSFTPLDPLLPANTMAQATGVNNAGMVSGFFVDPGGVTHGFLLNGTAETTLDDPSGVFTQALGLNNKGQVVGFYMDAGGAMHGFVYAGGVFTTVNDPSGVSTTIVNGTNDLGQLVGFYVSGANTVGFVATPTPEPASLLLMGSGLLAGLGVLRRKLRVS